MRFSDLPIAAEAIALAIPIEIGLRCATLDALLARLDRPARQQSRTGSDLDTQRAARIVERLGSFYPMRATCLKKSLVLLRILRRRGIPAELRLGVRKVEDQFSAHAWIESCGRTFLGTGIEASYQTLPLRGATARELDAAFPATHTD